MKNETKFILSSFIIWRIVLYLILFGATAIPLSGNFLGGGLKHYSAAPWIWSWSNFDGEHYLSIAQKGYESLNYFFFPFYPLLIRTLGNISSTLSALNIGGQIISIASFLTALFGFWKLVRMDYKKSVANTAVFLLLIFPTSFYFAGVYTESLFLVLAIWSFIFARKKKFLLAGILGLFASSTRIVGLALFPAIVIEYFGITNIRKRPKIKWSKDILYLLLTPLGTIAYMVFLSKTTGDPLKFFHGLNEVFGEQRSSGIVLLPQVFYRYVIKILPSLNYSHFISTFPILLEFVIASAFLALVTVAFWKQRFSYFMYSVVAYLMPTFSGSFSSMSRYVLIIFPSFILAAKYLTKMTKLGKIGVYALLFTSLIAATALFLRGYWIA